MRKEIFRTVQFLSNMAIIGLALIVGIVVLKQYWFSSAGPNDELEPGISGSTVKQTNLKPKQALTPIGKLMPIENIDWKANRQTLVLYLSTTCRYCTESAPFYRRLVKEANENGVKVVAVLSQDVEESKEYLKSHDLDIPEVQKASIASIGITATPTLLLVTQEGKVVEHWKGRLQADKEKEVLSKLES